jgi:hypothetical protein
MLEETASVTMFAAVAGLAIKEFFAWLRARGAAKEKKAESPAGGGSPGHVDMSGVEAKLDRLIAKDEELLDVVSANKKSLAAIVESTQATERAVARHSESLLRLERSYAERLRQALEGD